MRNRFYNWVARQIVIESSQGQLTRSVTIRILFAGIVVGTLEYSDRNGERIKLISKDGKLV